MLFDVDTETLKSLQVNVRTLSRPQAIVFSNEEDEDGFAANARSLAEWVLELEETDNEKARRALQQMTFGVEQFLTIEIRYSTPVGTMLATTDVQTTETGRKGLSLQQLPASFLADYQREMAAMRRAGGQPAKP
jgi:hypothetical protein